jgi:hypothetical protein
MSRRFRIRDLSFDFDVTIAGVVLCCALIPFRWSGFVLRESPTSKWSNKKGGHLMAGPFHLWFATGYSSPFALSLAISQDPFHGGKLVPREVQP